MFPCPMGVMLVWVEIRLFQFFDRLDRPVGCQLARQDRDGQAGRAVGPLPCLAHTGDGRLGGAVDLWDAVFSGDGVVRERPAGDGTFRVARDLLDGQRR